MRNSSCGVMRVALLRVRWVGIRIFGLNFLKINGIIFLENEIERKNEMKDFIALTHYDSDENILVRKSNIMAVYERYKSGNQTTSILSLGNGAVIEVKEDWCKIVGYLTENENEVIGWGIVDWKVGGCQREPGEKWNEKWNEIKMKWKFVVFLKNEIKK